MDGLIGVIVAAAMGVGLSGPAEVGFDVVAERSSDLVEYAGGTGPARASAWRLCDAERTCRYGVAVTDDGFATRAVLDLPPRRYPLLFEAGDTFVVLTGPGGYVADTDGRLRRFTVDRDRRRLADGEVAVSRPGRIIAVDPVAATAHLVGVPPRTQTVWDDGGVLRGLTYPGRGTGRLVWSRDGGATWRSTELPRPHVPYEPQPAVGGVSLMSGGDTASMFPFVALHRYDPRTDTWTSSDGPTDPLALSASVAELPDGRLVTTVPLWSDARPGKVRTQPGIWVDGERVEPGPPFDDGVFQPHVLDLRRTTTGVRILVEDRGQGWVSRDLGRSWRRVDLR